MFTRISSFVVSLVVLAFGLAAFTPSAFGCAGQGAGSCREASVPAVDLFAMLVEVVRAAAVLLP